MFYYGKIKFDQGFNITVGIEEDNIIFSHCFAKKTELERIINREKKFFPRIKYFPEKLELTFDLLKRYRKGERINPSEIKVKYSRGTEFQKKVYKTLKSTQSGEKISYSELALRAGFPGAARAVGTAMNKNYLLLFVPCHRVIQKNGNMGNFGCGQEKKELLLDIEKTKNN